MPRAVHLAAVPSSTDDRDGPLAQLCADGPLSRLLADDDVAEICVNAPDDVWVERAGRLARTDVRFGSVDEIEHLIEAIVSPLGLRIDPSSPWVDARLPDGSRVHAVVPPIAVRGPTITIRKFSPRAWGIDDLVSMGALTPVRARTLRSAVRGRRNVLVTGGSGAGKTTILRVLAGLALPSERIVTIEDAAELRLRSAHVVALEARPANIEGRGEVTLRDLVRCAMRMRPDRIIVGEVRGPEALDMVQALNSGHEGSMGTVHASSPREALVRLETMLLLAAPGMSIEAAKRLVSSAVDLLVHVERLSNGRRRVSEISSLRATPPPSSMRTSARKGTR